MTETMPDAAICPLCGGSNQCAIAAGQPPESCWCKKANISTPARKKAANTARERCICPSCGQPGGEQKGEQRSQQSNER